MLSSSYPASAPDRYLAAPGCSAPSDISTYPTSSQSLNLSHRAARSPLPRNRTLVRSAHRLRHQKPDTWGAGGRTECAVLATPLQSSHRPPRTRMSRWSKLRACVTEGRATGPFRICAALCGVALQVMSCSTLTASTLTP